MTPYNQMNVCRPVWMAIQQLQKFSSRTIEWDRVWGWLEAIKRVFTLIVRHELPPPVAVGLIFILLFVKAWVIVS
jgi:hypothetical protein